MTPEDLQKLKNMLDTYGRQHLIDRDVFQNPVYLRSKIAFFGASQAVGQQDAISVPTGGSTVDTQARAAIDLIITTLQALNLTK